MSKTNLLLTDSLFVIGIALLLYSSKGKLSTPLIIMSITAVSSCVNRHVNYFKQTKRLF